MIEKLPILLLAMDFGSRAVRQALLKVLISLEKEKYSLTELLFNISCHNITVVAKSYKNHVSSTKRNKAVESCYFLIKCHRQLETVILM